MIRFSTFSELSFFCVKSEKTILYLDVLHGTVSGQFSFGSASFLDASKTTSSGQFGNDSFRLRPSFSPFKGKFYHSKIEK